MGLGALMTYTSADWQRDLDALNEYEYEFIKHIHRLLEVHTNESPEICMKAIAWVFVEYCKLCKRDNVVKDAGVIMRRAVDNVIARSPKESPVS